MKPSLPPETGRSSLFEELHEVVTASDPARPAAMPLCRSSTMLRALLGVHAVIGVGLMFAATGPAAWLEALAVAATLAVPATLIWLLAMCAGRHWLARRPPPLQWAVASAGGAAAVLLLWWPLHALGLYGGTLPQGSFDLLDPGAWKAALAPGLAGAMFAGLIFQAERWRERARLPAAATARLADLQTRIRPHFLFNTLNTAITLVQLDPRRAEEVLEDLADLFRAALGALDQPTTLAAEIQLSRRYLAIESLRFGERLEVVWELDPAAGQARLPPLALQPLIENAVRHGVEPSDSGGLIEIRTLRRRDRVLVSVTNTVPAAAARPGHGIGLASVRERLRLMHDLEAEFRFGLIDDGRYRVSMSVPA